MSDGSHSDTESLRREFEGGLRALQAGNTDAADAAFRAIVEREPRHAGALNGLGLVAVRQGDTAEAKKRWDAAVAADPRYGAPHLNLGNLKRRDDPVAAVGHYQKAMACEPGDPQAAFGLATLLDSLGRSRDVANLTEEALKRFPGHPGFVCLQARGRIEEGRARDALESLSGLDAARLPPRIAQMVHYTRVAAADRIGDPQTALGAAQEGAAVLRQLYPDAVSQASVFLSDLNAIAANYRDRDLSHDPAGAGSDLVFLVGFPGSGEERLGRVLSRHPKLAYAGGNGALNNTMSLAFGVPAIPRALDAADLPSLRARYERGLGIVARDGRIRVDHLPLNLAHVGFAAELFPAARFVLTERDPVAACLAACLRDYELTPASANLLSFESAARLYGAAMGCWAASAPALENRTLRIAHDRLVHAPRETLEGLLSFLGLPGAAAPEAVAALEAPSGPPIAGAAEYEADLPAAVVESLRTGRP